MFGKKENKDGLNRPEQEDSESADAQNETKDRASEDNNKDAGAKRSKMISVKESDFQKLNDDLAEYKDRYVRLYAEFENARKRMERDKMEFVKYANEGVLRDFLDILDNLERSVEAAKTKHEDYTAFLKGIEMVMAHTFEMLKRYNVRPIESVGKGFDPNYHEPLLQEEKDDAPEMTVLEEFQKGYMLGDRVLRTSKVKISRKKDSPDAEAADDTEGAARADDDARDEKKTDESQQA